MESIYKIVHSGPLSWVCLARSALAQVRVCRCVAMPRTDFGSSPNCEIPSWYSSMLLASLLRFALIGLSAACGLLAQPELAYRITTVAGDDAGNLYVAESFFNIVLRVNPDDTITRIAGTGDQGFAGDGGRALEAQFDQLRGVDLDAAGNLYVADSFNGLIRRIDRNGVIESIAGNGAGADPGNGGPAVDAVVFQPHDIVIDRQRNILYLSEPFRHRIRRIDLATGTITGAAGNGEQGDSGEGGPAVDARLNTPRGLGLDRDGALLIADSLNFKVKRVAPDGTISTIAGDGRPANSGDGGPAVAASLAEPWDVIGDPVGNVVICNVLDGTVRMVNAGGVITTLNFPEGLQNPQWMTSLGSNDFIVVERDGRRLLRYRNVAVTTVAGVGRTGGVGDGGPATSAKLLDPLGVAIDPQGNVLVGDFKDTLIRRINADGRIESIGEAQGADLAFDSQGRLHAISGLELLRFDAEGNPTVVAGNRTVGSGGDGGPATQAQLLFPEGLALDGQDNILIGGTRSHRIRRVDAASGVINSIAGAGTPGDSGDGGAATEAEFNFPRGLAVTPDGTLLIADTQNHRVRELGRDGIIRPFAGTGSPRHSGDGGAALDAELELPLDVAVDRAGNAYISTSVQILKVTPDGVLHRIAGLNGFGFSGDGGPAREAELANPFKLAVNDEGVLYFTDRLNLRVRRLAPVNFFAQGVVHSANFTAGAIAPGQIISIFGVNIGPAQGAGAELGPEGCLLTTIGGVQVLFNGIPGPIFFTNSGQINVQVPYEVAGAASVTIQIIVDGVPRNSVVVPLGSSAPGIYALAGGTGQIVAFNQDGTLNGEDNPARIGEVIVFFASGEGQTNPAGRTGKLAQAPFPAPTQLVVVEIGGQEGRIAFAAGAPGFAGLMQVNVFILAGSATGGQVSIILRIGPNASPVGTTVAIAP